MAQCAAFDPTGPYVRNIVGFVDCHMVTLGEEGYRALGPGTAFGALLTGLLTIYVALIGYRMILGHGFALRDWVGFVLRIGIVLALATQWSAYRPLAFDLATKGPEDIMTRIFPSGGLGGDNMAGLTLRVQGVNDVLDYVAQMPIALTAEPTGGLTRPAQAAEGVENARQAAPPATPMILTARQQKTLGLGNMLLLLSTLAGILAVHVVVGLLLALGPLFVAFLLFDATHGLLAGWVRVLAGTALGAVAVPLVVSLCLAVLEPQVIAMVDRIDAGTPVGALATQIFATTALFALILAFALFSIIRTAAAFRLPVAMRLSSPNGPGERGSPGQTSVARGDDTSNRTIGAMRSRAQGVADAVMTLDRREERLRSGRTDAMRRTQPHPDSGPRDFAMAAPPLGQAGRRATLRQSVGSNRRDRTI